MKEQRRHNTGLAKVAVQCSADTFVVNQTLVLRINICGENRHLRQARKRCSQLMQNLDNVRLMRLPIWLNTRCNLWPRALQMRFAESSLSKHIACKARQSSGIIGTKSSPCSSFKPYRKSFSQYLRSLHQSMIGAINPDKHIGIKGLLNWSCFQHRTTAALQNAPGHCFTHYLRA
jgi:hypothetical protein